MTQTATEQQQGNIGTLHRAMAEVNGNDAVDAETVAALQSLEPSNRPEYTLKQVLQVLLAQEEQISVEQEALLREVAQRCPTDDGFGVYIARAALLKIDTIPVPYSSDCERVSSAEEIAEKQKLEEEDRFQVYPNPTTNTLYVEYTLEVNEQAEVKIYGIAGNLVLSQILNTGTDKIEIDLSPISSGMYLLSVDVNGEIKLSERVSVINQ